MSITFQKFTYRKNIRANSDVFYLFGDNEQRKGYGGQAKEMRDEPNAIGIRTKVSPDVHANAYWSDDNIINNKKMLDNDLYPVFLFASEGKTIVIPKDGLGTGLSRLPQKAPITFAYLQQQIIKLCTYSISGNVTDAERTMLQHHLDIIYSWK